MQGIINKTNMHPNEKLLTEYYTAFQKRNHKSMNACYADNVVFNDPLYTNLDAAHTRAMWELFCVNGKDLKLEFSGIKADDTKGEATWKASYIFSSSGNRVEKEVVSKFEFQNGKISRQEDDFDFRKWAGQALGLMGSLLGWTGFVESQVKENAKNNLDAFMSDEL
jgi:ketosteroid isomerase-like protein